MSPIHFPRISSEEAASMIKDGQTVAFSGFTAAGSAKAIPRALARQAKELHAKGKPFQLNVLSGASTGKLDDLLAEAQAVSWRSPYQSSKIMRQQINEQKIEFNDMHLSHLPQAVLFGFLGNVDWAVIEASEVTSDGRIYLSSAIGASPTFLHTAENVIIELNRYHTVRLSEMADIVMLPTPPHRSPIPIYDPLNKIGLPYASVDPKKIIAVIDNNEPDGMSPLDPPDEISRRIAHQVVDFLLEEQRQGRIPPEFLPLQAGVGNIANAVMSSLGDDPDVPAFTMYTEVFQDALIDLMEQGHLVGASTCSLTVSDDNLQRIYNNMDFFVPRIVLRPQELSNNPGVIRRLGVIALNTALEFDIYGHANSTHVCGTDMVNGIGGSGDFMRNAYLSIFMAPSAVKNGRISTVVPMVSHSDHNEHSVQVFVTEQGLADVRGLGPREKVRTIIDKCAHPDFRDYLHRYVADASPSHITHNLKKAFELHTSLLETGTMKFWE
jgi:propionyl-CoA:succinyl-CoA transferase